MITAIYYILLFCFLFRQKLEYVYVMHGIHYYGNSTIYKIGKTNNPDKRLTVLQQFVECKTARMILLIATYTPIKMETYIHRMLRGNNSHRGENFSFPCDEDAIKVVSDLAETFLGHKPTTPKRATYYCVKCPMVFTTDNKRSNHMRNDHNELLRKCTIPGCDYARNRADVVKKHQIRHQRRINWEEMEIELKFWGIRSIHSVYLTKKPVYKQMPP